jgi:hypothetical protein
MAISASHSHATHIDKNFHSGSCITCAAGDKPVRFRDWAFTLPFKFIGRLLLQKQYIGSFQRLASVSSTQTRITIAEAQQADFAYSIQRFGGISQGLVLSLLLILCSYQELNEH